MRYNKRKYVSEFHLC